MDKLHGMKIFIQIVERGSLTRAAEAVNMSLPAVVRMLAALEAMLGVRLLNRTTRRIALTEEGRQYLERCRRILADVEEAESELTAGQQEPHGSLNVTAPVLFGQMHVTPCVTSFVKRYRHVQVEMLLLDRVVNLVEDGMDVAIRIGHLADSSLIAIPVGHIRRVVCASPTYLRQHGTPKHPDDIAAYDCVRVTGVTPANLWQFRDRRKTQSVKVKGAFVSNQAAATIEACAEGLGLGMFLSYQVRPHLKAKTLQSVLDAFEPPPIPVSVIYPHAKLLSARVRTFVDWIVPRLRQSLAE